MPAKSIPPVSLQVSRSRYCHFEKRIERSRPGLHLACAGHEVCRPDYNIQRLTFPCYGLEYVESGSGSVWLAGQNFPLRAGVLFVYGPGTRHHILSDPKTPLRKYFVDFFGRESAVVLAAGAAAAGTAVQLSDLETCRAVLELMLAEGDRGLRSTSKICASLLRILIWKTAGAPAPHAVKGGGPTQTFEVCRDLIDARHLEFTDLDAVAHAVGIDKSYLCRLFQSHGYPPPFRYLIRKKIHRAAEWLMNSGGQVKDVALRVGFADPYHFSRVFKREMGQSPRMFIQRRK
jgi:AraC-like DNA-binding protein